jgi:hypothetical protein
MKSSHPDFFESKAKHHNESGAEPVSAEQLRLVYLRGLSQDQESAENRVDTFLESQAKSKPSDIIIDEDIRRAYRENFTVWGNEIIIDSSPPFSQKQ